MSSRIMSGTRGAEGTEGGHNDFAVSTRIGGASEPDPEVEKTSLQRSAPDRFGLSGEGGAGEEQVRAELDRESEPITVASEWLKTRCADRVRRKPSGWSQGFPLWTSWRAV